MARKSARKPKPKLSDAERHKRFVETAEKLGADKDAKALDRAFKKISSAKRA